MHPVPTHYFFSFKGEKMYSPLCQNSLSGFPHIQKTPQLRKSWCYIALPMLLTTICTVSFIWKFLSVPPTISRMSSLSKWKVVEEDIIPGTYYTTRNSWSVIGLTQFCYNPYEILRNLKDPTHLPFSQAPRLCSKPCNWVA